MFIHISVNGPSHCCCDQNQRVNKLVKIVSAKTNVVTLMNYFTANVFTKNMKETKKQSSQSQIKNQYKKPIFLYYILI